MIYTRNHLVELPYGRDPSEDERERIAEQNEYLWGVLCADRDFRFNEDPERNIASEIDPYGTGTKHFWRGVLETSGTLIMPDDRCKYLVTNPRPAYPRLSLEGGERFMDVFRMFLEEKLTKTCFLHGATGKEVRTTFAGKGMAGTSWNIQGRRVQEIVSVLYSGYSVSRESFAQSAHAVLAA